ncbi:MAG: helix-turn-helix domain-containing protein [Nitrosopumilaceae archaeon]|uniref:Helix-turn-helix domain-containing protein n=1 Tax=Candidatus Nitrosomaritimum aestuariumsis TaxID=3342354 RepID=A0AC60WA84_9ARCH|nr:helix-turn-helix domain-containing protein [Nitrosopumilaceae archaeon]
MSLERVLKTLEAFGLSRSDSEVYLYLAKKGPRKGSEVANALKISKQQLYSSLKNLKNKGIVNTSFDRPALFSALAFEEVLELLIRIRVDQAKAIRQTKNELLKSWRSMKWRQHT